jgi:hypothetical protein
MHGADCTDPVGDVIADQRRFDAVAIPSDRYVAIRRLQSIPIHEHSGRTDPIEINS